MIGKVVKWFGFSGLLGFAIAGFVLWAINPSMTYMQAFLRYWYLWAAMPPCTLLWAFGEQIETEDKTNE